MTVLKLKSAVKDYLWGGRRLSEAYGVNQEGIIAESWVVSCHPDGPSTIIESEYEGMSLISYIDLKGKHILGSRGIKYDKFPILCKLLDAQNDLSIQVHPNNEYALRVEHEFGKNEMWLVLEAKPGSRIYYGVKEPMNKQQFKSHIEDSTIMNQLNAVYAQPYDVFYIPAGTIHALGKGFVVAEIQQSSNSTYRIYDYDRVGPDGKKRELHIEKSVEVSNLEPSPKQKPLHWEGNIANLIQNEFFQNQLVRNVESTTYKTSLESFQALVVTKGKGKLKNKEYRYDMNQGDGFFVEAGSEFIVDGQVEFIIAQV